MADTQNLQDKTQTAFLSLSLITQACHGVLNTSFTQPSSKPAWYDSLAASLDQAKVRATDWIDNLAPGITGGVPLAVINYGTTYQAMTAQIMQIVQAHPDAQGADDPSVKEVAMLVTALQQEMSKLIASADATAAQLKTWGDGMQQSHDDLSSGAASIQSAETDLQADINKMNNAISTLNDSIQQENIAIAVSGGAIGVGIFLTVIGIALAPETGGASLVVAGTGGLMVIGGAVTWGVMQDKINKQFDQIGSDQKQLDSDQAQMVALQGLAISTSQAVSYITQATSALSDFRTSWAVFEGEIKDVAAKLQDAEDSLSTILQGAFTQAAATEWDLLTQFAQQLAATQVQVANAAIGMDGSVKVGTQQAA